VHPQAATQPGKGYDRGVGVHLHATDRRPAVVHVLAVGDATRHERESRSDIVFVLRVKLVGAGYLLYLVYRHFGSGASGEERRTAPKAQPWMGLSAFWATVVKVELTDIVFAVDSILVAVAMSSKTWVVLAGGLIGIVAMRVVISHLLAIVRRYPTLVDGAFVIIAIVGMKLLLEYADAIGWLHFEIPRWVSLTLIAVTFLVAYIHARRKGPVPDEDEDLQSVLADRDNP